MRAAPMQQMIALAHKLDAPIAAAVRECAAEGGLRPALLLKKLVDGLGLEVTSTQLKVLFEVVVHSPATEETEAKLLARGVSGDPGDALLQAVLGYLRELENPSPYLG